jgi:ribonuclease E
LSLSLVRIIEEEALKAGTARVDIQVPVDVATYILNEKRQVILDTERQTGVHVLIVANPTLETPQYKVERVRKSDHDENDDTASYQRADKDDQYSVEVTQEKPIQLEKAAVSSISPGQRPAATAPAPVVETKTASTGLLGKIVSIFSGDKEEKEEPKAVQSQARSSQNPNQRSGSGQNRSRSNRGRGRSRNRKPDANRTSGQGASSQSKKQTGKQAANKPAAARQSKDATDQSKDSAQTSGQPTKKTGRSRRRRPSNRSKNSESNATEVKSNDANKQNAGEASTPVKKQPAKETKPAPAEARQATDAQEKKPAARDNTSENKPATDKPSADRPAADKNVSAKPAAEKKPEPAQSKTTEPVKKDVDKQPSSNDNRPATSVIDD